MSNTDKSKNNLLHSALAGLGAATLTAVLMFFEPPPPPEPPDRCGIASEILRDDALNKGLSEQLKVKIRNEAANTYLNECSGDETL